MATLLEKVSFHSNPKERQCQRMLKLPHIIALISHTSKVMLKILQARLQQYVNCELPDVQAGFRKGRGIRDKIVNIHWIIKKAREFQKNMFYWLCQSLWLVDHNKLWKILKEMGIPDHFTCLLRNRYTGFSAVVKKQQLEPDMQQWTGSKLGQEYVKAVYCHSAYWTYKQNTSCEITSWNQNCWEKYQ